MRSTCILLIDHCGSCFSLSWFAFSISIAGSCYIFCWECTLKYTHITLLIYLISLDNFSWSYIDCVYDYCCTIGVDRNSPKRPFSFYFNQKQNKFELEELYLRSLLCCCFCFDFILHTKSNICIVKYIIHYTNAIHIRTMQQKNETENKTNLKTQKEKRNTHC